MSTPSSMTVGADAMQQVPASPAANDDDNVGDIPRRPMRVKVLYTFDDQNKSNCLARLPNVLSVPVVSLDENTQVGVIELKTCIQAIVAASPELTAKLGHDYTVYAYDFSEYETPLVGQGMLSWILASASATPNAPAEDSRTMVTGRVCKNILGLFSNGIKETLEVKLKLVPVPTSMQKEYVENMERYHSLSQIMPEGFDYSAWSDFLKENPTLGQLAQPAPNTPALHRSSTGGYEPFHQMLTRHSPSQEPPRNDSFYKHSNASFMSQQSRASSPANSNASFRHIPYNPDPRPASRASVRSEMSTHSQQYQADTHYIIEPQEDGPPKKRARITQATRPRNTPLTARNDSLHKTAATASSVWLHRPIAANSASSLAEAELHPRAPTPRPGDMAFGARGPRRLPAPSALRHGSMDAGRPYESPYDASVFSDTAADSGDSDRDGSPEDTPRDMPSSPPIVSQRTSPTPSSPTLPTLPMLTDSGFVSDVPLGREEDTAENVSRMPEGSDLPVAVETPWRRRQQLAQMSIVPYDKSHKPWQELNPGPTERLPQTYVPPPRSFSRAPYKQVAQSVETDTNKAKSVRSSSSRAKAPGLSRSHTSQEGSNANGPAMRTRQPPTDSFPFPPLEQSQPSGKDGSPDSVVSQASPGSEAEAQVYSREATPNLPAQWPKTSKSRGLPRSHTWSGTGEPMSDAPTPSEAIATDPKAPRSGSHAKRKKYIKDKLQSAIETGKLPDHCQNCGEIETPTWRKSYTRIEFGTPEGIELSSAGIVAYEVIEPTDENGGELMYRIYRNTITNEEKQFNLYETLNLCNPCGLWLVKKGHSRPQRVWDKSLKPAKRKDRATSARNKSVGQNDDTASDAVVPHSDAMGPDEQQASVASLDGQGDQVMPPPSARPRASSPPTNDNDASQAEARANSEAEAALQRAIQSSPAGFRKSKDSSVDVGSDLTPRPTRRLLFPSPRKNGEIKSLDFTRASSTTSTQYIVNDNDDEPERPRCERCKRLKRKCDRERPCERCIAAGLGHDECIPCKMPPKTYFDHPTVPIAPAAPIAPGLPEVPSVAVLPTVPVISGVPRPSAIDDEDVNKENCPPVAPIEEHDDLAYLFETPGPAKTTPKKDEPLPDILKTPTPGSRRRVPLTPRRGVNDNENATTPSRNIFTPRTMRSAIVAPETPFTRQLNAMLSDAMHSSPSHHMDFSAFPVFGTPGRATGAQFSEFLNEDFLSSDMPASSSPAKASLLGLGFDLYEDPNTSTVGMWTDANMFGNDTIMLDVDNDTKGGSDMTDGTGATAMLKMSVGGITVDFASMIEEVVGNNEDIAETLEIQRSLSESIETQPCPEVTKTHSTAQVTEAQTGPEAPGQGLAQTPEAAEGE